MQLWAVTMVKDEADIIAATIGHLDSQGLDGIIVADNMSTDGTTEIIAGLKTKTELIIQPDTEVGYYQSRKMTELAHLAFKLGADWVIPFDADELWYAPNSTLRRTLEQEATRHVDCLHANLHNYFPTNHDRPGEPNPFLRIAWRDPKPAPLPKVVVRSRTDLVIAQGNHGAGGYDPFVRQPTSITVAHFPWRSFEQYEHKVRNGSAAYRSTDLPADIGAHWRQHGTLLDEQGPEALRWVFNTYFLDPEIDLEYQPAPYAGPPGISLESVAPA